MKEAVVYVGFIVLCVAAALLAIAGWVSNVVWTFHQTEIVPLVLGAIGAFVAPIGVVHGIWLWF